MKTTTKAVIFFITLPVLYCFLFGFITSLYDSACGTEVTGPLLFRVVRVTVVQTFGALWLGYLYLVVKFWSKI